MSERETSLGTADDPRRSPEVPASPALDPITGIAMPDEPADDLALELQAAGVAPPVGGGPVIGAADARLVDSDGPLPRSTAPASAGTRVRIGDRIFTSLSTGAGVFIVVL